MRVYQFRHVGLKAKPNKGCSTSDVPNNTCNTYCGQLKPRYFLVNAFG
jgi:hypothetical protein